MGKNKTVINIIVKLTIAGLLLFWFLHKSDISKIFGNLLNISLPILVLAIFINFFSILVNSYKWKILLPEFKLLTLFNINLIGQFFNTLLPGQVTGEAAKAYLLGKGKEEGNKVVASVFIDKVTGLIGLLILGAVGLVFSKLDILFAFSISIVFCIIIMLSILFSIRIKLFYNFLVKILKKIGNKFKRINKYCNHSIEILNSWDLYLKKPIVLLTSIIIGIVYQLLSAIMVMLLAHSYGINISIIDWFWILAVLSFALLLPVSIGGIGLREGTIIGILGMSFIGGYSNEIALTLSFAIYGLQIILAISGLFVYLKKIKT